MISMQQTKSIIDASSVCLRVMSNNHISNHSLPWILFTDFALLIVTAAKSTRHRMNENLILDFRPGRKSDHFQEGLDRIKLTFSWNLSWSNMVRDDDIIGISYHCHGITDESIPRCRQDTKVNALEFAIWVVLFDRTLVSEPVTAFCNIYGQKTWNVSTKCLK